MCAYQNILYFITPTLSYFVNEYGTRTDYRSRVIGNFTPFLPSADSQLLLLLLLLSLLLFFLFLLLLLLVSIVVFNFQRQFILKSLFHRVPIRTNMLNIYMNRVK